MNAKKEPGKAGRPRKLLSNGRPKWKPPLQQIEHLASLGFSNRGIAEFFAISEETLYKHIRELPALSERLRKGRGEGQKHAARYLREQIEAGNAGSTIFYLKSRHRWREDAGDLISEEIQQAEQVPLTAEESRDRMIAELTRVKNVLQTKVANGNDDAIALLLKTQDQLAKLLGMYPEPIDRAWTTLEQYGFERSQTETGYQLTDTTLEPPKPDVPPVVEE